MSWRRTGLAVLALAVPSVVGGGLAWACTAFPTILSVEPLAEGSPNAGPGFGAAGSRLSVKGTAVASGAPVTIRWNATEGPIIGVGAATASGKFTVDATVPPSAPGVYYLVANVAGVGVARAAFEVIGEGLAPGVSAGAASQASLWAPSPAHAAGRAANPAATIGLGLLGIGLVGVFGGVAVATLARRPRPVTAR